MVNAIITLHHYQQSNGSALADQMSAPRVEDIARSEVIRYHDPPIPVRASRPLAQSHRSVND